MHKHSFHLNLGCLAQSDVDVFDSWSSVDDTTACYEREVSGSEDVFISQRPDMVTRIVMMPRPRFTLFRRFSSSLKQTAYGRTTLRSPFLLSVFTAFTIYCFFSNEKKAPGDHEWKF